MRLAFGLVACLLCGCSGDPEAAETDHIVGGLALPSVNQDMPAELSSIGLYPDAPDLSEVAPAAFAYEPRWPLWTNGSHKQRFVAVVGDDAAAPDPDQLEPGTYLFKTFSYDDAKADRDRPIETRVMRLGNDGWEYYRYLWNEASDDAELLTSRVAESVSVTVGDETFDHEVPGDIDCERCHEASENRVLGYRDYQLSDEPIEAAPDARTEAVMAYVVGNCTHCHNGFERETSVFDLRPDVFLENTIDRQVEGSASGTGIRVVPGKPDDSFLYVALAGGDEAAEIQAMPPLGVQRRDADGLSMIRAWIEQLPEAEADDED